MMLNIQYLKIESLTREESSCIWRRGKREIGDNGNENVILLLDLQGQVKSHEDNEK